MVLMMIVVRQDSWSCVYVMRYTYTYEVICQNGGVIGHLTELQIRNHILMSVSYASKKKCCSAKYNKQDQCMKSQGLPIPVPSTRKQNKYNKDEKNKNKNKKRKAEAGQSTLCT